MLKLCQNFGGFIMTLRTEVFIYIEILFKAVGFKAFKHLKYKFLKACNLKKLMAIPYFILFHLEFCV